MKKKFISVLLSVSCALSLCACGASTSAEAQTQETIVAAETAIAEETNEAEIAEASTEEVENAETTEATQEAIAEEDAEDAPFTPSDPSKAVEEYYSRPEVMGVMSSQTGSMTADGLGLDIIAEGNDLIYLYTFEEDYFDETTLDVVSQELTAAMEEQSSLFTTLAKGLNASLGIDNCRVIIRYIYKDEVLSENIYE